jgi:glycosyltransferase involved in cell wall biosynthesis
VSRVALVMKRERVMTGLGRYAAELESGLAQLNHDTVRSYPTLPLPDTLANSIKRSTSLDLRAFFNNYPVIPRYPRAEIVHLTSQNLATLLAIRRPACPVVVTVHDILPYMLRDNPIFGSHQGRTDRLCDLTAMRGLRKADALIAISEFTKGCLVEHLGIPASRISVIHQGVDLDRFRPGDPDPRILNSYGLDPEWPRICYVGSEDPRKGLTSLIEAIALVTQRGVDVQLVKVGRAHHDDQRRALIQRAEALNVLPHIRFVDDVAESDLPGLYNLADIYVQPSIYEGFGLPAIEAMACGRPVISADAGALKEVVGSAGVLFAAGDSAGLADILVKLLRSHPERLMIGERCRERAGQFSWRTTVERTANTYRQLLAWYHARAVAA